MRQESDNKKKKTELLPSRVSKKMTIVFVLVILAFVFLVGKITYINATSGDQYERNVLRQQNYESRVIPFRRGAITDRNGTVLANSERVYNVILDAKVLLSETNKECVEPTVHALTEVFGIPEEEIRKYLSESPESRYIILKKQVDYDLAQAWRNLSDEEDAGKKIAGIWLEDDFLRTYPYGSLASDLLGFSTSGNNGNWGLELFYNDELNGTNGRAYGFLDNDAGLERTVKKAVDGNSITSTIDANLQTIVERHMLSWLTEHDHMVEARSGCENLGVILMDPDTGEILTMASYPNYDLNNPRDLTAYYSQEEIDAMSDQEQIEALQKIWRNFCVSDTYEPGSTAKVFTVAAGYETGFLNGTENYYCDGAKEVSEHVIHCHDRSGHGEISLQEAITQSCNVALMDIALGMGDASFYKYHRAFGFGEFTNIDLPGEADTSTLVYDGIDTVESDLATNSFGQNFNCTMIQMAAAYCSLINGGHYYQPYCVKEILDPNGDILKSVTPNLLKETVTEETSAILRQYMLATVQEGTGMRAQVPGYSIAGKTGTAEMLPRDEINYVISFAGFAPADHPRILMYVVIDRPNALSQEDTSLVTSLASDIFAEILPYLNIPYDQEASISEETESIAPDQEESYGDEEYFEDEEYYEDGYDDTVYDNEGEVE